jgi:fumarate hydratase class I
MISLDYPFTEEKVRSLNAGDYVRLSGLVFTARDKVHKFLYEGGAAPADLADGAIYHCGPVAVKTDGRWVIRAAGPTTSLRNEPYMAGIIRRFALRVIIGKGGMGDATLEACRKHGCVYLEAVGGAACVAAQAIREVKGAHLLAEFGRAEAMWVLDVSGMECVVSMDTRGQSLHEDVRRRSGERLRALIEGSGK